MKTIEIQLYKFSELSETAKQKAHEQHSNNYEPAWMDEWIESIKSGLLAFGCELGHRWSIDYSSANQSYAPFENHNDNTEELSGQRLRTWLINNYYSNFFERKPQGKYSKNEQGKWNYKRRSRIFFTETSCPFTGYCGDEDFMDVFRAFILKPDNSTFDELIEEAIHNTLKGMESDYESQLTEEFFAEEADANGYEFTEDGNRY